MAKSIDELKADLLTYLINATKIPATKLNELLTDMLDTIDFQLGDVANFFKGSADPTDDPGTPTNTVMYQANGPGTYTKFGGLVITGNFAFLIYNGSTWEKSDQNIDMALYDTSVEVDAKISTLPALNYEDNWGFPISDLAWKHPRGDSEYAAGSTYFSTGIGIRIKALNTVVFKKVKFRAAMSTSSAVVEIKVFKTTAEYTGGSISGFTQLGPTYTISAGEWNLPIDWHELDLGAFFKIYKDEYVYILAYGITGTSPKMGVGRFTTLYGSEPERLTMLYNTNATPWSDTWTQLSTSYLCEPMILLTDQLSAEQYNFLKNISSDLQASLDSKVESASDGAAVSIYLPENRWKHPRGDAEYVGDSSYGGSTYQVGIYEKITDFSAFNRIKLKLWNATLGDSTEVRIYKNSTGTRIVNPSNANLILLKTVIVTDLPSLEGFYTIELGEWFKVDKDDIIQIFTVGTANAAKISRWSVDAGSEPFRTPILLTNNITPWTADWGVGGSSYLSTSMWLLGDKAFNPDEKQDIYTPNICTADKVYVAIGRELNIWYDELTFSMKHQKIASYGMVCDIGKSKERSFRFTPTAIGTHTLTIYAYDANGNTLESKIITIEAVAKDNGTGTKQMLFVGDSLMSGGSIVSEVNDLITTDGGITPTMLGTRGTLPDFHEGRAGCRWVDFTTVAADRDLYEFTISGVTVTPGFGSIYSNNGSNWKVEETNISAGSGTITCSKYAGTNDPATSGNIAIISGTGDASIAFSSWTLISGNPFWDDINSRLDFQKYMSDNGFTGNIDFCYIMLGINDNKSNLPALIIQIKDFIDALLSVTYGFPACKIMLGLSPLGGDTLDGYATNYGAGIGWLSYEKLLRDLYLLMIQEFDKAAYNANVSIVSSNLFVDRHYGYSLQSENISARMTTVQYDAHINYVHPTTSGYEQIADAVYSHIRGLL